MQIVENNQKVRFSQDIRVEQRFSNMKGIKILKWSQVLPARYSSQHQLRLDLELLVVVVVVGSVPFSRKTALRIFLIFCMKLDIDTG